MMNETRVRAGRILDMATAEGISSDPTSQGAKRTMRAAGVSNRAIAELDMDAWRREGHDRSVEGFKRWQ